MSKFSLNHDFLLRALKAGNEVWGGGKASDTKNVSITVKDKQGHIFIEGNHGVVNFITPVESDGDFEAAFNLDTLAGYLSKLKGEISFEYDDPTLIIRVKGSRRMCKIPSINIPALLTGFDESVMAPPDDFGNNSVQVEREEVLITLKNAIPFLAASPNIPPAYHLFGLSSDGFVFSSDRMLVYKGIGGVEKDWSLLPNVPALLSIFTGKTVGVLVDDKSTHVFEETSEGTKYVRLYNQSDEFPISDVKGLFNYGEDITFSIELESFIDILETSKLLFADPEKDFVTLQENEGALKVTIDKSGSANYFEDYLKVEGALPTEPLLFRGSFLLKVAKFLEGKEEKEMRFKMDNSNQGNKGKYVIIDGDTAQFVVAKAVNVE